MPGTQKMQHTAAGYLKYISQMGGSPELCLKPIRFHVKYPAIQEEHSEREL